MLRESVLAWRSRQGAATLQAAGERTSLPQETCQGAERLDIRLSGSGTHCHTQYQRGCQDLVALTESVSQCDPLVVMPLIHSFKHTLRKVDLECGSYMKEYTVSKIIGRLLGILAELQYLRFVALDGLSQQNSIAIFKGRSYEELESQQFVVFGTSAGREAG